MRSFIIMKIVRMRAVFIVIALRATKPVQSPKKWCVTRVESRESKKERQSFLYLEPHLCSEFSNFSNCTWFWFVCPRPLSLFEAQFYAAFAFCILCVLAFYEPHVDRKTNSNGKRLKAKCEWRMVNAEWQMSQNESRSEPKAKADKCPQK